VAAVTEASALALFGANGGEGLAVTSFPAARTSSRNISTRAPIRDDRQWGCDQFIHIGLNLHRSST